MNEKRILVDQRWIGAHGVGRYASEVLPRLHGVVCLPEGVPLLSLRDPLWIRNVAANVQPDVYFTPGYNPPILPNTPIVCTIHDVIHLRVEAERSAWKWLYYRMYLKLALQRVRTIITVSEFSKSEIATTLGIDKERICVVRHGISQAFTKQGSCVIRNKPYILCIGNVKPHKNVRRLIQAYGRISGRQDIDLVIVCPHSDQNKIRNYNREIQRPIVLMSNVNDDKLARLYRGASLTIMPSLYEGFGLPAYEAAACGSPVALANIPSLRELPIGGAVYFDPTSIEDMSAAMETALMGQPQPIIEHRGWQMTADDVSKVLFQV